VAICAQASKNIELVCHFGVPWFSNKIKLYGRKVND